MVLVEIRGTSVSAPDRVQTQDLREIAQKAVEGDLEAREELMGSLINVLDRCYDPKTRRHRIILMSLMGITNPQIAEILALDERNVKAQLSYGRSELERTPEFQDTNLIRVSSLKDRIIPIGFISSATEHGRLPSLKIMNLHYTTKDSLWGFERSLEARPELMERFRKDFGERVVRGDEGARERLRKMLFTNVQMMSKRQGLVLSAVLRGQVGKSFWKNIRHNTAMELMGKGMQTLEKDILTPMGIIRISRFHREIPPRTLNNAIRNGDLGHIEFSPWFRYTTRGAVEEFKRKLAQTQA